MDERRAKSSPYCLSCGSPLGTPPPAGFGKQAAKGSALPWILGGIGVFLFLGIGAVIVLIVLLSDADPDPTPVPAPISAASTGPRLELPPVIASGGKPPSGKVPPVLATAVKPPTTPKGTRDPRDPGF